MVTSTNFDSQGVQAELKKHGLETDWDPAKGKSVLVDRLTVRAAAAVFLYLYTLNSPQKSGVIVAQVPSSSASPRTWLLRFVVTYSRCFVARCLRRGFVRGGRGQRGSAS